MALWGWGKKREEKKKSEGPFRIISIRQMYFSEVKKLLKDSGNVFDKKCATFQKRR